MSCREWEKGEVRIPAGEWSGLKRLILSSWNDYRERVFRLAMAVYAKTGSPLHGTWDQISSAWVRVGRASDDELDAIERLLFPRGARPDTARPRKPTRKQLDVVLPKATRRTFVYRLHHNALILLRDKDRTVVWQVEEGNHACDRAREHPVASDFFRALAKVRWKRGSGGVIFGNDEYRRDAEFERPGAGGSYVVATYGAAHKMRRAA